MDISRGEHYYSIAHKALSGTSDHPGFEYLKKVCSSANGVIVDMGCGEGSRLDYLVSGKNGIGVEINGYALKRAKKQYPRFKFVFQKDDRVPLDDGTAAVTYSTFVLEHTLEPEKFISEMARITRPGGLLVILCPNFGAPNRRSPNSVENPIRKLVSGFRKDIFGWGIPSWTKVIPKKDYQAIDDDTTVEPYLLTLEKLIGSLGLTLEKTSSLWELEASTINPRKLIFKILGRAGIYPFSYWGPQIFFVAKK